MVNIWPVIHVGDALIAVNNARIAHRCGADGVMLISMHGANHDVDQIAALIRYEVPHLKVGANYLGVPAAEALARSLHFKNDATWTDEQGVRLFGDLREHQFFAGVAFKGQPREPDAGAAALLALSHGLIPTTSGTATGYPPNVSKLYAIRDRIGKGKPLAIASGVTPENVRDFTPYVTDILVATGISESFYQFDEAKLAALMRAVSR